MADRADANRDPITGEPGAHPIGTGAGAAAGGATGATVGAIGGPVGAVIGGAVGAVVGGLAGKGAAVLRASNGGVMLHGKWMRVPAS